MYISKTRKIIFIGVSIMTLFICYMYILVFSNKTIDVLQLPSTTEVDSKSLTTNFLVNEKDADLIYTDKVVEVVGKIKEVSFLNNRNTLILQGEGENSGVICDMNPNQSVAIAKLTKGDEVRIKGVCKGFLKDVIMLDCILIPNKVNE